MTEHIQINDVAPRVQYLADGVQSAFPFPFAIFADTDLEVWQDDVLQSGGYSVSGAGISTGGTALFTVAPTGGTRVTLRRRLPIRRTTDYQADGVIRAKTLNDEMDYQVAALQQVAEASERAIRRAATSSSLADLILPEPVAGKAIGWNAAGTGLTNDPAEFAATVTAVTAQAVIATNKAAEATTSAANAATSATTAAAAAASAGANASAAQGFSDQAATSAAAAQVAKVVWRGAWDSATAYAANDAVGHGGGSWICIAAHTNQPPADNGFWDVLAAKGTDGTGAGDMLATNNLSELTNPATARANLGLGSAALTAAGDYLARSGNLSDLTSPATARSHLGLGDAATKNTGTGAGDIVALDGSGKLPTAVLPAIDAMPVGMVISWAGPAAPSGSWLECNGQNVSRATYTALFAAIGTTWGMGDGGTTFGLPDLRGRALIGSGQGSGLTNRALAAKGGAETHTLSVSEMPWHVHGNGGAGYRATNASGEGGAWSGSAQSTDGAGGGSPHNNMQPFAVVAFYIKAG